MNSKINITLILCVAFFPYSLQCQDELNREKLYNKVEHRPTDDEIANAISDSNVIEEIQANILEQLFFIRRYPSGFIQSLNSQNTMSLNPIKLRDDEIALLSSEYDHSLLNSRIVTQLKLYRKIQEIQCTNYELLKCVLPNVKNEDLESVSYYVEYMINMSYKGQFIVTTRLWELHIKLLGLRRSKHFGLDTQTFLKTHLPEINDNLKKMIKSCQRNNYLKEFDCFDIHPFRTTSSELDDRSKQYFIENKDPRLMSASGVYHFFLIYPWHIKDEWFPEDTGFVFDWQYTFNVLKKEIDNFNNLGEFVKWITQPFGSIKYHETILNVVKAKFYCFVWLHLVLYKNTGVKARRYHDIFIGLLARIRFLDFLYINDPIFNVVLISLSEICLPGDEKIDKLVSILSDEVNRILRNIAGPNSPQFTEITINEAFVNEKSGSEDSEFLENLASVLETFVERSEEMFSGLTLNVLLFYTNGNKTVDFVLPNLDHNNNVSEWTIL